MQDLKRFNDFFMEKEEDCIIKFKLLEDDTGRLRDQDDVGALLTGLIDLHGMF